MPQPVSYYSEIKRVNNLPRLPLEGSLDLTYRCNTHCRHCWLSIPSDAPEAKEELTLDEIKRIVKEAKMMGCRRWSISGGEPMLRSDFAEIFDYVTSNSSSYSLNTNGTLITPKIAQLMKRKGSKMVALYGATAAVHDHITRQKGSFEATLRGFRYLKEAGAGFIVQLIPLRDNYHQFKEMVALAESLSKYYRIGAAWLYLSSEGNPVRNQEIRQQRLPPREAVELDKPDLSFEDGQDKEFPGPYCQAPAAEEEYLFYSCIVARRDFHIDPYGKMTFCCFIKDSSLRYDLRKGSFKECWEEFIPSLAKRVKVTPEYRKNCGSCELKKDCRYCPVYGYLEHGRFTAKLEYLCAVAKENKKFKEEWLKNHRRYFKIAEINIQVESDLSINEETFHPKFKYFETSPTQDDLISIRHHFSLPDLEHKSLGKEVYRRPPWAVYQSNGSWIYLGISPLAEDKSIHRVVVFNDDHTRARIYNDKEEVFQKGGITSLTLFPTDQILLARILADREGCYLHSCGVVLDGKGLLFVGHSEAGKSTLATLLKDKAEILCDDRIILRSRPEGFKIYGTWSHGDVADVSGNSAYLKGLFFLEKADVNQMVALDDKQERVRRILSCLIRPFVTVDWWDKTLSLIDKMVQEVPCYILRFDKSGKVVDLLRKL